MSVTRIAVPADSVALLAMMREFYAIEHLKFDERSTPAALGELLTNSDLGLTLLITDGAEAVGYVVMTIGYSLEFFGRTAFIDELYVVPAAQRRGLATKALAEVETRARHLGLRALHLEVDHENPSAERLYDRLGFRHHPRHLMTKVL
jgi:ribosomal protein S18 acetylase RimI-like enzyme